MIDGRNRLYKILPDPPFAKEGVQELAGVGGALRRAAKRAREIAAQTNTPIVVYENGKVVKKKVAKK